MRSDSWWTRALVVVVVILAALTVGTGLAAGQEKDSLKAVADSAARLKWQAVEIERLLLHGIIDELGGVTIPDPNPDPGDSTAADLAFPGAEGWGRKALTTCDRSSVDVRAVTSLDDSGPGTLREAVEGAPGDRLAVVVIRVAGHIRLADRVSLAQPCVYVAGQTAPGDGVTITGGSLLVRTNHVALRYLRHRGGTGVNFYVGRGSDVILDHLSSAWSTDKLVVISRPTAAWGGDIARVTLQRSLLAEALAHPTAMQITGPSNSVGGLGCAVTEISIHQNVHVSDSHRNPQINACGVVVSNTVVYNWTQGVVQTSLDALVDVIRVHTIPGPMTGPDYRHTVSWRCDQGTQWTPSLYTEGNSDDWARCYYRTGDGPLPESYRRMEPLGSPVTYLPPEQVIAMAGANAQVSCDGTWEPHRDGPDERFLADVANGTGPARPPQSPGPMGALAGTPCPDRDGDGMPDSFEDKWVVSSVSGDPDGDGWTNIEEYVNGTRPVPGGGS